MRVHSIDLLHGGLPGAISAYLILDPEPTVVDPGPATSLEALRSGLAGHGLDFSSLHRVALTHVHLDHAGGTGHILRENPDVRVYVHEDGAEHMVAPERLVASTRRTFGEAHDRLWGEALAVPSGAIDAWGPGAREPMPGMRTIPTPGHISHHVSYLDEDEGTFLAGDALGIILGPGAPSHPPTPPPAVDVVAWRETLERIRGIGAECAGVAHFGFHEAVMDRALELRRALDALEARVRHAIQTADESDREVFAEEVCDGISQVRDRDEVHRYFDVFSAATDWDGMKFYLDRL